MAEIFTFIFAFLFFLGLFGWRDARPAALPQIRRPDGAVRCGRDAVRLLRQRLSVGRR
ncbi:MAG: hypothetical protein VW547_08790 [Alphaproteobacteria bacterium]